jgi:hypothetical protein
MGFRKPTNRATERAAHYDRASVQRRHLLQVPMHRVVLGV